LFVGPPGVGKRTFALKLAQALLCQGNAAASLDPCNVCESCVQALAGTHPDIDVVAKPDDKATIPLELFIGDKEHRRREGLCHNISLRPFFGKRKIAIIDDADLMAAEGANSLLKTLEEPPPRSVLILIGTSAARQLPTIRSRCQAVHFAALSADQVKQILLDTSLASDPAEAARLAHFSGGSLERAVELGDADLWEFRDGLLSELAAPVLDSVGLAPRVAQFVDAAGKEAPRRRARLRQVIRFATDYYRALLRALGGGPLSGDESLDDATLVQHVERAAAPPPGRGGPALLARTARRLDRCLEAAEQVDRNANQTTLIEAWLDALAE
jgi:DNA polymerase-3 subunit delta'